VVAAGALVPPGTVIPSGQVWAGSPAKFLRNLMAGGQKGRAAEGMGGCPWVGQ